VFDLVVSLRDHFATYHANKEREAYVTGALYLGSTVAILSHSDMHRRLLFWGFLAATVLALSLVGFQLYNRLFAARMAAACTTLSTRWLTFDPTDADGRPVCLRGVEYPEAVVQQFRAQSATLAGLTSRAVFLSLLVWGLVVIWCLSRCQPGCAC
jgi:hypothetical protein